MSCLSYFQCFLQGLSDGLHAIAFVSTTTIIKEVMDTFFAYIQKQKLFYLKDKFIIQTVSNADIVYANFRNLQRIFPTRRS